MNIIFCARVLCICPILSETAVKIFTFLEPKYVT